MESFEEHLHEIEEWRAVVGKAIVSFGELELITQQCLVHLPTDKISETSSKLPFGRRADLVIELLGSWPAKNEAVTQFIEMLKRARKLAETRNHIAHNPVMMNLFLDHAKRPFAKRGIVSARGERLIDLEELKEFADEVEDLAATMWLQIGKVSQSKRGIDA